MLETEKKIPNLKKIWDSMFCAEKNEPLECLDEKFLPLSLLIKAFQIQLEELKTIPCSCNHQEPRKPVENPVKDVDIQDNVETGSANKTPEKNLENPDASIDIVNSSNFSGLDSSPILKSKGLVNHKRKVFKKRLYTSNNQLNKSDESHNEKKARHSNEDVEEMIPKKLISKAKSHCGVQMFPLFETSSKIQKKSSKLQKNYPGKKDLSMETFSDVPVLINNKNSFEIDKKTPPANLPEKTLHINFINDETFFQLPSPNATLQGDNIPETFFQPAEPINSPTIMKSPAVGEENTSATFFEPAEPSNLKTNNNITTFLEPPIPRRTFFRLKKQTSIDEKENEILVPDSDDDDSFNKNIELEKFMKESDDKGEKKKLKEDGCVKRTLEKTPPKKNSFVFRRDAVRKKEDRAKLLGQACKDCIKYYNVLDSLDAERFQERLNKCSKHRENEALSYTPAGYWNPLFTPTQKY